MNVRKKRGINVRKKSNNWRVIIGALAGELGGSGGLARS